MRAGLACPTCGFLDSDVLDTRSEEGSGYIRRRRVCTECKYRYTTREIIDADLTKIMASHEIVVRLGQILKNLKE